jgi:hypothetical protein
VRGLTAPLSAGKFRIGSRGHWPCVAACQMGGLTVSPYKHAACQPRWLATLGEQTQCAKLLPCNVRRARTGTTRRRRTRRRPRAGWSSPSSAIPAASTRTTKRRSKYQQGTGNSKPPNREEQGPGVQFPPGQAGGVSSTAKLSVSKTDLLGSNPSSPASFTGPSRTRPGGAGQTGNTAEEQSA